MMEGTALIILAAGKDDRSPDFPDEPFTCAVAHLLIPLNKCLSLVIERFKEICLSGRTHELTSVDQFMTQILAIVRVVISAIAHGIPNSIPTEGILIRPTLSSPLRCGTSFKMSSSFFPGQCWW